jgi:hypothetical protein
METYKLQVTEVYSSNYMVLLKQMLFLLLLLLLLSRPVVLLQNLVLVRLGRVVLVTSGTAETCL